MGGSGMYITSQRVSHSEARAQGTFAHAHQSLAASQASLGRGAAPVSQGDRCEHSAANTQYDREPDTLAAAQAWGPPLHLLQSLL